MKSSSIDSDKLKDGLELLNIKFPLNGEFLCQLIENRGDNREKEIFQIINNLGIERKMTFISGTIENQIIVIYRLRHKGDYEELLNYSNDVLDKLNNLHGLAVVSALGEVKKDVNELKESYNEAKEDFSIENTLFTWIVYQGWQTFYRQPNCANLDWCEGVLCSFTNSQQHACICPRTAHPDILGDSECPLRHSHQQ